MRILRNFPIDIADVSHFVHPETPMDTEAAARGTTVYLVDKRIDMLPSLLGTNLCSLRPFVERLAFSAFWVRWFILTPHTSRLTLTHINTGINPRCGDCECAFREVRDRLKICFHIRGSPGSEGRQVGVFNFTRVFESNAAPLGRKTMS